MYSAGSSGPEMISSIVSGLEDEDPEITTLVSDFTRVRLLPKVTQTVAAPQRVSESSYSYILFWYCVGPLATSLFAG